MADRYWRLRRSVPGVGEALELRERQLVLLLMLATTPLTTRELARRSGVSAAQVDELLAGLDVCQRSRPGEWSIQPDAPIEGDAQNELRIVERSLRTQTRALGRSLRAEGLDHLARAEACLRAWDIEGARRLLARHGLSLRRLLALVPPSDRGAVRARFMDLYATTLTNAGAAEQAIQAFERWRRSVHQLPADAAAHLLVTISAAYRMLPHGVAQACGVLDEAERIVASNPIHPARRRWLRRWLFTVRTTSLTLRGNHAAALEQLARATDSLDGHPDEYSEVELYRIRTLLALGRREQAARVFDEVARRAGASSLWVQGWLHRYHADVIAGGPPSMVGRAERPAAVVSACLLGWQRCRGFGFQQRLLLARIAVAHPSEDDIEAVTADHPSLAATFGELRRFVAACHRQRHGRRPSECGCADDGLASTIVHAFDLHEPAALHHLT